MYPSHSLNCRNKIGEIIYVLAKNIYNYTIDVWYMVYLPSHSPLRTLGRIRNIHQSAQPSDHYYTVRVAEMLSNVVSGATSCEHQLHNTTGPEIKARQTKM